MEEALTLSALQDWSWRVSGGEAMKSLSPSFLVLMVMALMRVVVCIPYHDCGEALQSSYTVCGTCHYAYDRLGSSWMQTPDIMTTNHIPNERMTRDVFQKQLMQRTNHTPPAPTPHRITQTITYQTFSTHVSHLIVM